MKNNFSLLGIIFFSISLTSFAQNLEITEKNGGMICGYGTMPNDSNLIAPAGMGSYLWSNGSTSQTSRFFSYTPGLHTVWCVIGGQDTLWKTLLVLPPFSGPHYLKKDGEKIFIDIQDSFVLNGYLKCHWYKDGEEIARENTWFIIPKESGKYTAKISHPCYDWDLYIVQKYINIIISSSVENAEDEFKVFPNPAKDFINISLPDGKYSVILMNSIGQILENSTESGHFQKNISNLVSGFYFLRVNSKIIKFQKI